jgi:hypothetical protein
VVPEVYMINAVESAPGSVPAQSDVPLTGTCAKETSGHCGSPIVADAPESRSMCSRSIGPASAGIGTTGTPAIRPATTPTTVSRVAVARMATAGMPASRCATAAARPISCDHDTVSPATVSADSWSPNAPCNDGRSALMAVPR